MRTGSSWVVALLTFVTLSLIRRVRLQTESGLLAPFQRSLHRVIALDGAESLNWHLRLNLEFGPPKTRATVLLARATFIQIHCQMSVTICLHNDQAVTDENFVATKAMKS